jgi:hypothetical protein
MVVLVRRLGVLPALPAALTLGFNFAEARTWLVLPDGTGDAPTLQAAADSSSLGDSIVAAAGLHQGPVVLASETYLVGEGAGSSVIVGTKVDPHVVVAVGGGVSDLSLIGVGPAYGHLGGGSLAMEGDIEVSDCEFSGGDLALEGTGDGASIRGCTFDAVGIWLAPGAAGVEILDCEFRDVLATNASVVTLELAGIAVQARVENCRFLRCAGWQDSRPVVGWDETAEMFDLVDVEVVGSLFDACLTPAIGATNIAVVARNVPVARGGGNVVLIEGNTIARSTSAGLGSSFNGFPAGTRIHRNAVTGCEAGVIVGDNEVMVTCNNVWGNANGNWVDGDDRTGVDGNISESPFYCAADVGNYTLAQNSPMLPGNNPCAAQIGAFGQGCGPVSVEPSSWAGIKTLYRDE